MVIKKYPATFDLAYASVNNIFDIYKRYADIEKLEVSGNDIDGFHVLIYVTKLKNKRAQEKNSVSSYIDNVTLLFECLPKEIDGVEIRVCFISSSVNNNTLINNELISTRRDT